MTGTQPADAESGAQKTGVVLFNLGGPQRLSEVRGFLFRLFCDPAIIGAPAVIRYPLALLISFLRNTKAQKIYAAIGGGSPLLRETEAQAKALEKNLGARFKCVIAMRYTAPRARDAWRRLQEWGAEKIIFLPMYPQYSASTTGSSFADFEKAIGPASAVKTVKLCCYPRLSGFTQTLAGMIGPVYEALAAEAVRHNWPPPRLLLSAHGLPEKMIAAGDPYAFHCEQSAAEVVAALGIRDLDWKLSYQSRVGPLEWIKPYTEAEIAAAGAQKRPLLIAPLAFTADNSETLYEIDQLYRDMALEQGCPRFASLPCVGIAPLFIEALAQEVKNAAAGSHAVRPAGAPCPREFGTCACKN